MQPGKPEIIIFLFITTAIILLLAALIITLIYLYQKRQDSYRKQVDNMKIDHEKNLMAAQLEMQENTFQNISREIHDNISLSLTLAKLHLNTFDWSNQEKGHHQLSSSIEIIGHAISNLSGISKSLNSDVIRSQGLIQAIENELIRIRQAELFTVHYNVTGIPTYMDIQKELIAFRIIQEVFNNVIKHALAEYVSLRLQYTTSALHISISDNGRGFEILEIEDVTQKKGSAGLKNIQARIKMIGGTMKMKSMINVGTSFSFTIPI